MPTGRPQTLPSSITKPVTKSSYAPEGTPSFTKHDLMASPFGSVPRTVFSRKDVTVILGRELLASIKRHLQRCRGRQPPNGCLSRSRTMKHAIDQGGGKRRLTGAPFSPREPVDSLKVIDHIPPIRDADIQPLIRLPRRRARHPNVHGGTLVEEIDRKLPMLQLMGSA